MYWRNIHQLSEILDKEDGQNAAATVNTDDNTAPVLDTDIDTNNFDIITHQKYADEVISGVIDINTTDSGISC